MNKNFEYESIDRSLAIESAKRLIIDSIWKNSYIELPRAITFPETNEIFEGRVPENASVEKVIVVNNIKHAWQFLLDNIDYPIDYQLICEYNHLIGEGGLYSNPGKLRTMTVGITGTDFVPQIPSYDFVKERLDAIAEISNPVERALTYFLELSRGQWFNNGNKRTAQMVTNHALLQANCGLFALPTNQYEQFVEKLLSYYESGNEATISDFLYTNGVELLPSGLTPKMIFNQGYESVTQFLHDQKIITEKAKSEQEKRDNEFSKSSPFRKRSNLNAFEERIKAAQLKEQTEKLRGNDLVPKNHNPKL